MSRSSFNRDPEDLPLSTLELTQRVTAGPAGSALRDGGLGPGFNHPATRFPLELAEHVGSQRQRFAPANSSGARLGERLMKTYLPIVEQLSQLFRTIGTIVLHLVDSQLPLALNGRGVLNGLNAATRLAGVAMLLLSIGTAGNAAPTTADSERSSHFEDVIFLTDRPILIRFYLQVDGQPWNETRDRLARRQFDRLDRDRDGLVSPEQLASLPLPELDPDAIANWDVSQDGKLSADEFLSLFSATSGPSFLLAEGASRATRSVRLFARLDADEDRRLTPAEFDRARATLSKLDFDDDETVSTTELAPFRNPLLGQVVTASDQPVALDVPFVAARNFPSPADLAELLLRRYSDSTSAASSEELPPVEHLECSLAAWGASGGDSAQYDRDSNGRLSHAELTELVSHWDPELEVLVELPGSKPSRPKLSVLADRTETKERSSRRASDRLGLELQKAQFDLRTEFSAPRRVTTFASTCYSSASRTPTKTTILSPTSFLGWGSPMPSSLSWMLTATAKLCGTSCPISCSATPLPRRFRS